jgi:hypothetical protein
VKPTLLALAWLALVAGCDTALPESGSESAALYARRCGTCHPPYRPGLLTAAMWETMVERMEREMARHGAPLAAADKTKIIAYLERNAHGAQGSPASP